MCSRTTWKLSSSQSPAGPTSTTSTPSFATAARRAWASSRMRRLSVSRASRRARRSRFVVRRWPRANAATRSASCSTPNSSPRIGPGSRGSAAALARDDGRGRKRRSSRDEIVGVLRIGTHRKLAGGSARGREVPKGAKCQRARSAREREVPESARETAREKQRAGKSARERALENRGGIGRRATSFPPRPSQALFLARLFWLAFSRALFLARSFSRALLHDTPFHLM